MYVPLPFTMSHDQARELLSQVRVGQLVTATDQGPLATMLPVIPDLDNERLVAHMARPNPQWQRPWRGQALFISEGANGYVSPSWYASKGEHGRVVPTWNYIVLQVYGDLVVYDDPAWVSSAVHRLTDLHELGRATPWAVDDAPEEYIDGQLKGIVGIELRIDRVEVGAKMSQNKSEADVTGVIAGFASDGHADLADHVRSLTQ